MYLHKIKIAWEDNFTLILKKRANIPQLIFLTLIEKEQFNPFKGSQKTYWKQINKEKELKMFDNMPSTSLQRGCPSIAWEQDQAGTCRTVILD